MHDSVKGLCGVDPESKNGDLFADDSEEAPDGHGAPHAGGLH